MKPTRIAMLVSIAILSLTACSSVDGSGAVNSGTVIGKRYFPPEYVTVNGQYVMKPECYRLNLHDRKGRIGPVCVSSNTFASIKIGDSFNVG